MFEKIPATVIRAFATLRFVIAYNGDADGYEMGNIYAMFNIEHHVTDEGKKTFRVTLTIDTAYCCVDSYYSYETFTLAEFKTRAEARAYIRAVADIFNAPRV